VELAGWSPHSGDTLSENRVAEALDHADGLLASTAAHGQRLPTSDTAVRERTLGPPARPTTQRKAALFGLGNYAKTIVLPNVRRHLLVECVHEIDPTQIGRCPDGAVPRYDSSPQLREDERYDAVFVAGFHHGHADLAVDALRRGAAAVIEKPLATTSQQLHRLLHAMRTHDGRVFACFQRRFSPFNRWIHTDLGIPPGAPISYHATVFEVPLPLAHWYRWRSSASRLVSNGCHWIDHFLFLNDFGAVHRQHVFAASDGTLNVSMELQNGALFTMVLTDRGADRIGVQDHVELRCSEATATITNASSYRAERRSRILRSVRCDKMASYRLMYDSIARAIAVRSPGDSVLSVERSTHAVLNLEQVLSAL
jgi:predicted dehydrogenase